MKSALLDRMLICLACVQGLFCHQSSAQSFSPFYQEDFASGLSGGWMAYDNSASGINWKYTTTGAANPGSLSFPSVLSANGTSAANGYMIYDSDSAGQSVGGEDADLISPRIDCSGRSNIHLALSQLLVHLNEIARVYVSVDSTSWTEVARPSDSLTSFTSTTNPDKLDIDISAIADSQQSVWLRFNFFGDYDFWWMVDDVLLYELPDAPDLVVAQILSPLSSCSGLSAAEPVILSITNNGSGEAFDYQVGYILDNGAAVTETISDTLISGMTAVHQLQTAVDLSMPSNHSLLAFAYVQNDRYRENDSMSVPIVSGPFPFDGYSNSFESVTERAGWKLTDANNDGRTWIPAANRPWDLPAWVGDSCFSLDIPGTGSFSNDWLVSPCITLSDTEYYQVSFKTRAKDDSSDAIIRVVLLSDTDIASVATVLTPFILVNDSSYTSVTTNAQSPTATGTFHFGIQALSAGRRTSLRIDDFRIEKVLVSGITQPSVTVEPIVFPNPFTDRLLINALKSPGLSVVVIDMEGRVVVEASGDPDTGISIDTSGWPAGIYCLEIHTGKRFARRLVAKQ